MHDLNSRPRRPLHAAANGVAGGRPPSVFRRLARWCGGLFAKENPSASSAPTVPFAPSSLLPGETYLSLKSGSLSESPKRAWLLEALSERMLRHHPSASWRRLFIEPDGHDQIVFEDGQGVLLCAHVQDRNVAGSASIQSEFAFIAASHRAEVDPCPSGDLLMCFDDPGRALGAALDLHQLAGGARLQVGLAMGERAVAVIAADGSTLRVSLGAAVDCATRVSRMAPAGTVRMEPAVFELVQDRIRELARCVVSTEYDATGIEAVSLVMAPNASEALSTFAGLGSA
jgi:class 3 adenylate cyclase